MSVQTTLEEILGGTLDLREGLPVLSPQIEAQLSDSSRQFRTVPSIRACVSVTAPKLLPVLLAYLEGSVGERAVSEWASFVLAVDAYALPESPESDLPQSEAEAIRHVLWSLSGAPISDSVTPALVREYVDRLRSLS